MKTVHTPYFRQYTLCIGFPWPPPKKTWFFSESQIYWIFSSLNPPYIWKVTKFLVEISQFEFLVMKEKNIFG